MANKRPNNEPSGSGEPPTKKKMLTTFEPVQLGPIYNLEDLDFKTLQFQNKRLVERIEQRRKCEDDLRKRIEQLEKRQTTDDAVLMIVNRYWNTLDEDIRVLLQRFDAETTDEAENENESSELTSFLALLSTWDKVELEQQLYQRVEFSKRAIRKLLQAFDRLQQRNEKLQLSMADKVDREEEKSSEKKDGEKAENKGKDDKADGAVKMETDADGVKKEGETTVKKEPGESENGKPAAENSVKQEPSSGIKTEVKEEVGDGDSDQKKDEKAKITEMMKKEIAEFREENKRLHNLTTKLHQRHHETTLKLSELQDKLMAAETGLAEAKNKVEELEYNLENSAQQVDKYDRHLADAMQKLHSYEESTIIQVDGKSIAGVSKTRVDEIVHELEEQRELAQTRMTELEKLQIDHQEACKTVEQLKLDLKTLPESVISETTEYKCLQSQFSVLYNESMHIRTQLDDMRALLQSSKTSHLRQIEQMESDELAIQKQIRTEMIQLQDTLTQVRKEYEMLRIEFEQNLTANEQTGPINREMRNLIQSLQNHNQQLKKEVSRSKHRLKEAQTEITKLKAEGATTEGKEDVSQPTSAPKVEEPVVIKKEEEEREEVEVREKGKTDADIIKDLKSQFKKAQDSQKELKLLLDMYKSAPKEQKDKVQLMAAEKKAKQEIEDLKNVIRKMQEAERKEKRKLADEDAIRKIKKLEETIIELQKNLAAQKQREEALLNEMEVTGQAFEDMQEQNSRLIIQLREKDDANFKLMSERIKSNQIQKILREEKDVLAEQVATCQSQVEAQNLVVRKLEEKERILQTNMATVEKELSLRQQGMEMHKRKALESAQTAADLKLHLDKYQSQLKEAQEAVADKTAALEQESFKQKRNQEEIARLQRKLERQKKIEITGAADEVLMEEIKEYKEQLTCPSCKVKRKDAVLTKCFHVFCLECLRTRYETRQRKCPKCNAGFGANDYHRLFLS